MTETQTTGDAGSEIFRLRAYGDGYFVVNEIRFESGIILGMGRAPRAWEVHDMSGLEIVALDEVFSLAPDLVLLGTGARQHFPAQHFYGGFVQRKIALECMSTPAAVRTYNLLAEDGRQVLAMLMPAG